MKFYLSSYKLGDHSEELKEMCATTNKRVAYVPNALDFSSDSERRKISEKADIDDLEALGLSLERVDLRDYFTPDADLEARPADFDIIWVRGGNVFVLRQAMKLSGFDEVFKKLTKQENKVYGAYSAGVCVLSTSLRGLDPVDPADIFPYEKIDQQIWDGLAYLPYTVVPHYDSEHAESDDIDRVTKYLIDKKILFKALGDGEVIMV